MVVEPVAEVGEVVAAVAASLGQQLTLDRVLDVDVYRVHAADPGPDLVVRAFGPTVEGAAVHAAARVPAALAGTAFPAERCAGDTPVLPLTGGRHLLLTE